MSSSTATLLILVCVLLTISGCSSTGPKWGEGATWSPEWARVKAAAINAAADPGTWIPAAGAAAVVATDNDHRLSDHYRATVPLFGSEEDANEHSEELRGDLYRLHIVTMLLTPSGDRPGDWAVNKLKGAVVQEAALGATRLTTNVLKKNTDRKVPSFNPARPDHESFPSNHGTEPFAAAALIRRNAQAMALPAWGEYILTGSAYLAATGAAWGRIEMGLHYPSDQLASAAIGNFLALFINDAFMGGAGAPRIGVRLGREGVSARLGWGF